MKGKIFICGALIISCVLAGASDLQAQKRMRDYGIKTGIFKTGEYNAITDVPGVTVGHVTKIEGEDMRTGVTAIIPHQGNVFRNKVPAAIYAGNGFGKLAGVTQVQELGNIETPIVLTNTLNAPRLNLLFKNRLQLFENVKGIYFGSKLLNHFTWKGMYHTKL